MFLFISQVCLLRKQFVVSVITLLPQTVCTFAGEPSTDMALDFQSSGLSLLVPHGRGEVLLWVDDFVLALVNVKTIFLHLNAEFTHHNRRLSFVLICLHLSL